MRISDWSSDVCSSDLVEYALQHADPICVLWSTRFHMAHARPISGSISGRIARSIRVEYGAPGGDIPDRAACWLVCGPEFRDGQIVRYPVEEDPGLLADMHAVRGVGADVGQTRKSAVSG